MPPATPTPANAERLLKLRQAVVDAPLEQFDMNVWSCDTQACAAGWYVMLNPKCGLTAENGFIELAENADCLATSSSVLADHFGIDHATSFVLFTEYEGRDPAAQKAEFLAKLDALLATHGIAAPAEGATEGATT